MKLEEILSEIRKGKKFRRSCWGVGAWRRLLKDGFLESDGSECCEMYLHPADIKYDDWELVPEQKKHSCYIGLFDDGDSISSETEARVYEYARLNAENMKPLKSSKLVEVRKIEWEVSDEA
jgi:hypothetical protein